MSYRQGSRGNAVGRYGRAQSAPPANGPPRPAAQGRRRRGREREEAFGLDLGMDRLNTHPWEGNGINKQTRAKANGGEEEEGKGISSAATRPDAMGSYMGHGPQSRPSGPA